MAEESLIRALVGQAALLEPEAREAFVVALSRGDWSLSEAVRARLGVEVGPDEGAGETLAPDLGASETLAPEDLDEASGTGNTWVPGLGDAAPSTPRGAPSRPPAPPRKTKAAPPPEAGIPRQIGSFVLLDKLGEGAMGVVYRAQQLSPKRIVALKLVRDSLGSARARARFGFEAQILARLDHPGIARVVEAGELEGLLWFALEYVDGRPLDVWAKGRELADRLKLVAEICDAVHHAHARGVVHRDLKPGNILVGVDGRSKVLDFGIARAVDRGEGGAHETRFGEVMGTPAFMSPEQASGDPSAIDARSDVYSLGAILYLLLAGRVPLEVQGLPLHETLRTVREVEPVALGKLNPELRGDLSTIVSVALEKDVGRRYQSAAALAEDLRRYLSDQPIAARAPTAAQWIRRFARRNPALVGSFGLLGLTLVGSVVGLSLSLERVGVARDEAVLARQAAEGARNDLADRNRNLTFLHAEASLYRDPTRSLVWLEALDEAAMGPQAWVLAQEARGRGVAIDLYDRHGDTVREVVALPERGFATASYDGAVRRFDPKRRLFQTLGVHHSSARALAAFPDGTLVSGGDDGVVIWDDEGGRTLTAARGAVMIVAVSPDGESVAAGGTAGVVWWWRRDGTLIGEFPVHDEQINALTFSIDGRELYSGAEDARWFAHRPEGSRELGGQGAEPSAILAIHGGALSVARDGKIVRHDAAGTRVIATVPDELKVLVGAPDGSWFVAGGRGGKLWWGHDGVVDERPGHQGVVRALRASPDGRFVASGGDDRLVRIWDRVTGQGAERRGHAQRVRTLDFSEDGARLYSGGDDGRARVWEVLPLPVSRLPLHPGAARVLATNADGTAVYSGGDEGRVYRVAVESGIVTEVARFADQVTGIGVSQSGEVVATARTGEARWYSSGGGLIRSRSLPDRGDPVRFHPGAPGVVALLARSGGIVVDEGPGAERLASDFGSDVALAEWAGDELVVVTDGGRVVAWDRRTGASRTLVELAEEGVDLAVSPDQRHVAIGVADGSVWKLDRTTGTQDRRSVHRIAASAVAVDDRGRILVGSKDGGVAVVEGSGEPKRFEAHRGGVNQIRWLDEGAWISAGDDGVVWRGRVEGPGMAWIVSEVPQRWLEVAGGRVFVSGDDGVLRVGTTGVPGEAATIRAALVEMTAVRPAPGDAMAASWTEGH